MLSRRFSIAGGCVRRALPVLVLLSALIPWTLGPQGAVGAAQRQPPGSEVGPEPSPANVAPEPPPEPAARLQVVVKSVYIVNDRDRIGSGEQLMRVLFWRCSVPLPTCSSPDNPAVLLSQWNKSLDLGDGESETLDRVVPQDADVMDSASASAEAGIAVYAGQGYALEVSMVERDFDGSNFMGVVARAAAGDDWAIGVYDSEPAGRSTGVDNLPSIYSGTCAGWGSCGGDFIRGDYLVTYEIRRTPLPDLRPTAIRFDGPALCLGVENIGQRDAGDFQVNLRVDGATIWTANDHRGLSAGQSRELCAQAALPSLGEHELLVTVDEPLAVPEMDESNNRLQQRYVPRVTPPGPMPESNR